MRVAIIIDVADVHQNPAHPSGLTREAYNTIATLALGNVVTVTQVDNDGLPLDGMATPHPSAPAAPTATAQPHPAAVEGAPLTPGLGEMVVNG